MWIKSNFQCQYTDSRGEQCTSIALYRVHYSTDHPFTHMDFCEQHLQVPYPRGIAWIQNLEKPFEEEYKTHGLSRP